MINVHFSQCVFKDKWNWNRLHDEIALVLAEIESASMRNLDWKRLHDMACLSMIGDAKFICWPLPPLNVCFTKRYTYLRVIKILIPPWLHTSVQSWRNIFLIVRNVGPSIDLVKISAKFIFMSTCRALMRLWFLRVCTQCWRWSMLVKSVDDEICDMSWWSKIYLLTMMTITYHMIPMSRDVS